MENLAALNTSAHYKQKSHMAHIILLACVAALTLLTRWPIRLEPQGETVHSRYSRHFCDGEHLQLFMVRGTLFGATAVLDASSGKSQVRLHQFQMAQSVTETSFS